jgi:NADPH2:quinone reductase
LRRTYRVQPGDAVLIHAAAGGVGLIACQWAKAHRRDGDRHGTSSEAKGGTGQSAWLPTTSISMAEKMSPSGCARLPAAKGVAVVYDGVGKDTFHRLARLPAAARHDGQLRQCLRPGGPASI